MTKAQALLWGISGMGFTLGAMWLLLMNHSTTPHQGAVSNAVFEQVLLNQAEWRDEQRADMAEIKQAIAELRHTVMTWKGMP